MASSCHKPTLQESYARSKFCHAALDASVKLISPAQFKQAALDPSLIAVARNDALEGAWSDGKQIGMTQAAIASDIAQSSANYLRQASTAHDQQTLRSDVNECLGDYYGRPND